MATTVRSGRFLTFAIVNFIFGTLMVLGALISLLMMVVGFGDQSDAKKLQDFLQEHISNFHLI